MSSAGRRLFKLQISTSVEGEQSTLATFRERVSDVPDENMALHQSVPSFFQ